SRADPRRRIPRGRGGAGIGLRRRRGRAAGQRPRAGGVSIRGVDPGASAQVRLTDSPVESTTPRTLRSAARLSGAERTPLRDARRPDFLPASYFAVLASADCLATMCDASLA